jgi:hypothetical protein
MNGSTEDPAGGTGRPTLCGATYADLGAGHEDRSPLPPSPIGPSSAQMIRARHAPGSASPPARLRRGQWTPVRESPHTREALTRGPTHWLPGPRRATGETDPQAELADAPW